jgi:hypothetical protein
MSKKCPTCGQTVLLPDDVADFIEIMRAKPEREVYACQGGGYAISYGGGKALELTIYEAERQGLIRRKWLDKPALECWVLT